MPLRDHFRSPVDGLVSWQSFHAQWTGMIVQALSHSLPHRYVAVPCAHRTTESDDAAPAVWMPPKATRIISTDLPAPAEWGVRVCDIRRGRSLVAAVQFVNPANKDRREHRQAFVAKWVALLQNRIAVVVVDAVPEPAVNLYAEMLSVVGHEDAGTGPLYAVACRGTIADSKWRLEYWSYTLELGKPLPTLPLWVADNFAVPLHLEASYEETCRVLRIP